MPGEKRWSQARVAEATGVTLNAMTILEKKGAGTIETLVTLLTFYQGRGFNPAWVVLVDNSAVSKRVAVDSVKAVPADVVTEELSKFKERFQQKIDEILKEVENG